MRILILVIIFPGIRNDVASQVDFFDPEEYPEGSIINHIESNDVCYYYVTTTNDLDYPESDRLHTSVFIDFGCDLEDFEIIDLRDLATDDGDYEPEMLFKFGDFFAEFMNYRDIDNGIVVGEFILYDSNFNYLKSDTIPVTLIALYPVQRADKFQFVGLKIYPSAFFSMTVEFNPSDSSITTWEIDPDPLFISSMLYDPETAKYLVYHLSGFAKMDTSFNVLDLIHSTFVHTGVLGQLGFLDDRVISFGARLPPFVSKWQVTFNLYERDLTLLADETYGDTSQLDYPFLKHCLAQTEDAIFTGAVLDIVEDFETFTKPIEFVITKYNRDRTLIWRHNFGGDAAYGMFGLRATSDGGCVAYGNKHSYVTGFRHPFLIEIDENGLVTPVENVTENAHMFTLYGNPVCDEIRIHAEFPGSKQYRLLLSDVLGKVVLQAELAQGMNVLNVRKLPVANYISSILDVQDQRIIDSYVISVMR